MEEEGRVPPVRGPAAPPPAAFAAAADTELARNARTSVLKWLKRTVAVGGAYTATVGAALPPRSSLVHALPRERLCSSATHALQPSGSRDA